MSGRLLHRLVRHASPALFLTVLLAGSVAAQPQTDWHPKGYELVFSDDFDGDTLDRGKWCTRYIYKGDSRPQMPDPVCQADGRGTLDRLNDERQRYVDINAKGERLHEVKDGVLTLVATATGATEALPFESAMVRSKATFLPEANKSLYITARVWLPKVRGTWPAFWINPGPNAEGKLSWPPEIDIFDSPLNEKEDRENMLHVGAVPSGKPKEILESHPLFNRRWRNYIVPYSLRERWTETAIEWTTDKVCYFVDGEKIMCETYDWRHRDGRAAPPGHVLLNLAIGGSWAGRHGIDTERFPARFSVDHVRVFEKRLTP